MVFITDGNGHLVQHIQYVPFGEVFIEQRNASWSTPYKFNGKELDEETGLAYYHARYYDPRTSVWLSVDPLAEKFANTSSYVYCGNNPIIYTDPDGRSKIKFSLFTFQLNSGVIGYKINIMEAGEIGGSLIFTGAVRVEIAPYIMFDTESKKLAIGFSHTTTHIDGGHSIDLGFEYSESRERSSVIEGNTAEGDISNTESIYSNTQTGSYGIFAVTENNNETTYSGAPLGVNISLGIIGVDINLFKVDVAKPNTNKANGNNVNQNNNQIRSSLNSTNFQLYTTDKKTAETAEKPWLVFPIK